MDVNQMRNRPAISLLSWLPANGKLRGVVAGAMLATGMTALAAPPPARAPQRAAWLLPPQKLEPGDVPAIARGAIDDLPIGSTPVSRSGKKSSDSPAWLTGVDPNVLPASGLLPSRSTSEVRTLGGSTSIPPLTPGRTQSTASAASPVPSSTAKPYVPFPQTSDKSTATERAEAQLDPSTPLKGTAANGAPLLATRLPLVRLRLRDPRRQRLRTGRAVSARFLELVLGDRCDSRRVPRSRDESLSLGSRERASAVHVGLAWERGRPARVGTTATPVHRDRSIERPGRPRSPGHLVRSE